MSSSAEKGKGKQNEKEKEKKNGDSMQAGGVFFYVQYPDQEQVELQVSMLS